MIITDIGIRARHAQLDRRCHQPPNVGGVTRQDGQEAGDRDVQASADLHGRPEGTGRNEFELSDYGHHDNGGGATAAARRTVRADVPPDDRESYARIADSGLGAVGHLFGVYLTVYDVPAGVVEVSVHIFKRKS